MSVKRRGWLAGGIVAVTVFGVGMGSAVVLSAPMSRLSRWVGPRNAVVARVELGLWWAGLRSRKTLLIVGDSRFEVLEASVPERGGWQAVNVAMSGSTAADWHALLAERDAAERYDAALLWVGTNDFVNHDAAIEPTVGHAVAVARRLGSYARRVVVLEQIPVRLASDVTSRRVSARVVELNRGLHERLAREPGVHVAPLHAALLAADGLLAPWCTDDGLHLNEQGNTWLRRRIEDLVP